MNKTIITAAITGGIHVPSMSPYLPVTTEEIIDESVRACEAGAAVVHIHAREPEDGRPSSDIEIFREILTGIKARCDVIVCISTGGRVGMSPEERIATVKELKPELASFNTGSMNFALYPLLDKIENFKYQWEKDFLASTEKLVFHNTFDVLKHFCSTMEEIDTRPEIEIYDVGMINNTYQLIQEGYFNGPLYMQFVMGILGGIPAAADNLLFLYNSSKQAFKEFQWSVCAAGKHQFPMGVTNLILGGHMRVGLEDSLYIAPGELAKSNAEQVEKAVRLSKELFREPAAPDEVREMLELKGKDKVNF